MKNKDGYVTTEAAVLLPLASILILLLVWLCSYLYQGCFMTQAAYLAAFRGSRFRDQGEAYVNRQLDELLSGEALRFEEEQRTVEVSALSVRVALHRNTPFDVFGDWIPDLSVSWRAAVRDPVSHIRGIRNLQKMGDQDG